MSMPTDDAARKALPIWTGCIMYFPDVWAEIAKVSKAGNDQHNPGEPMHWAREKSTDQMNSAFRHMLDHATGRAKDTDDGYHLAKAIWRLCAELQLTIERRREYAQCAAATTQFNPYAAGGCKFCGGLTRCASAATPWCEHAALRACRNPSCPKCTRTEAPK